MSGEKTSLEEANGVATGVTGRIGCWNADSEARLCKAMLNVGKWVESEAGALLGHIKAAVTLDDGSGITLNLTDLSNGVEKHGELPPQDKVNFTFMSAVLDVNEHELYHKMYDSIDDSGLLYEIDEKRCHCHDHDHEHNHEHGHKHQHIHREGKTMIVNNYYGGFYEHCCCCCEHCECECCKHEHECDCGHEHHHDHEEGCSCGHDHEHHDHDHEHEHHHEHDECCCCGHNHEHECDCGCCDDCEEMIVNNYYGEYHVYCCCCCGCECECCKHEHHHEHGEECCCGHEHHHDHDHSHGHDHE